MDSMQFWTLAIMIGVYIFKSGKHSGEVVEELKGIHGTLDKVVPKVEDLVGRVTTLEAQR